MITIYSEQHRHQAGSAELIDGQLAPPVERPERAERILAALVRSGAGGEVIGPDTLCAAWLAEVHRPDYLDFLRGAWQAWREQHGERDALPLAWPVRGMGGPAPTAIDGKLGYYSFDAGTPITAGTWAASTSAADVALTGARAIAAGVGAAFSLCRPPGHHAAADCCGGYCFLNNAALAAAYLRGRGFARVAILDIDYHHGNGTQSIFYERDDVLFVSIHADPREEFPFFLGHGEEIGAGSGAGFNLNLPLLRGTGWEDGYGRALDVACERLDGYAPDSLVISLGVDTHVADPIGGFRLRGADYARIGSRLRELGKPALFVLEGGYALDVIGASVAAVLEGFEHGA